jgi:CubicO group peptidase (beta-lactamase class C family)
MLSFQYPSQTVHKLGLDDPIHQYLPDLPGEWFGVTVRQLLTHTSGIPDYEEIRTYDVYRFRLTPEEVIRIAHSRPMDFAPGTGWYYSNTGYFLLSMIVERIEGYTRSVRYYNLTFLAPWG